MLVEGAKCRGRDGRKGLELLPLRELQVSAGTWEGYGGHGGQPSHTRPCESWDGLSPDPLGRGRSREDCELRSALSAWCLHEGQTRG